MRQWGVASVRRVRGASFAALVLWLEPMTGSLAQANPPSPGGAIGLGNRGWSAADTNREGKLTRRRYPDCWHVYYGDVHVGMIAIRTGVPHHEDPWG